jgi:peroxiredoxin
MSLTASNMMPLGTKAPDFSLPDTISGKTFTLQELHSPQSATVVMFICNHCPFVVHVQKKLVEVANLYQAKGIRFIAISSNDIDDYPEDAPDKMREVAKKLQYPFPYLYDESQEVAKAYLAACTPDFYIFDKNLKCVYRGRFDNSRPGQNSPVTGADLTHALDAILAGAAVPAEQHPSMGCNIKWKHSKKS